MKVKGKIKVILVDEGVCWDHYLSLKVYFKEEGQIFNRTCERVLISSFGITYEKFTQFTHEEVRHLSDEEKLKEIAKDMVLKYYEEKENKLKAKSKETTVIDTIKTLNKKGITFEMEINK